MIALLTRRLRENLASWSSMALCVWSLGCTSIAERALEDATTVETVLQPRLQTTLSLQFPAPDDGSIPAEARALLTGELTEENAIRVAVLNNRELQAACAELGLARADLVQAGLLANPIFGANAKFFRSGTEIELGLSQSFLEIFYIPLRRRVAMAELERAKADLSRHVIRLVFDVRRAVLEVKAAQQVIDMRQRQADAAASAVHLMSRLHQAGNVTDPQLTVEEMVLTRTRMDLAEAEIALLEARESLCALLGLWGTETAWQISGDLGDEITSGLNLENVERRAVASSFDLASNRAHAEALAQRAGLSSWEGILPGLDLGPVAKRESGEGWGVGPGGSMSLPLFDHGQARVAAAGSRLRQAMAKQVSLAVEIRSTARRLRARLIALADRITYSTAIHLPLRARLVHETLQNFNAMQIGVFEVLQAKQMEIAAGRDHLETVRRGWLTRLNLEELLAGNLGQESHDAESPPAEESDVSQSLKGH